MKLVFVLLLHLTCSMESTCTYCLENITYGETTRTTLCNHQFHKKCINEWVDGNRTPNCPLCRQHVNSHRELIETVKDGDCKIQKCSDLLIEGVDINAKDDFGFNALHHAVYLQQYETVNLLLAKGAEVDAKDANDDTPLIQAAQFRKFPIAQKILNLLLKANANVNHVDKDKWSALMTAASYGNESIVQILFQNGADANLKNRDGRTARELSAGQMHVQRIFQEFEREKLVNIEAQKQKAREQNISFLEAAKDDDVKKVHDIIKKGADVNSVDFHGLTALHVAAMNGYEELVVELLKQSAEVNCRTAMMNYTPLMFAAGSLKPNLNIVKLLLEKGADKRLTNNMRMTAFDMAKEFTIKQALAGRIEDGYDKKRLKKEKKQLKAEEKRLKDQLPVLAEKRLNENWQRTKQKNRPQSTTNRMFVAAAEAGDVSEVEQLLRDGAHINCIDARGFTALHHATMAGNEELVKVLLTYNPNLQCKAPFHPLNAPLHFTAVYGYSIIMNMLLKSGANPDLQNNDGKTALDLTNDDNCKRLLQNEIGYFQRCLNLAAACGYRTQNVNAEVLQKIMK